MRQQTITARCACVSGRLSTVNECLLDPALSYVALHIKSIDGRLDIWCTHLCNTACTTNEVIRVYHVTSRTRACIGISRTKVRLPSSTSRHSSGRV